MSTPEDDPRVLGIQRSGRLYWVTLQPFWALFGTEDTLDAEHSFGASNRAELDQVMRDLIAKCSCARCIRDSYLVPDRAQPSSRYIVPHRDKLLKDRAVMLAQWHVLDATAPRTLDQEQERDRLFDQLRQNDRLLQGKPAVGES